MSMFCRTVRRSIAGLGAGALAVGVVLAGPGAAGAGPSQVIVTPSNTQGWSTADTRPGGAVGYVADSTAPGMPDVGALQLTTDATTAAKAQYMHVTDTALSDVTELSYWTKQNAGSPAVAAPSYQLVVCLDGVTADACNGFTTLVFEPYENTDQGAVAPGVWQEWNPATGNWWSSRSYDDLQGCAVVAGHGGPPFYTLSGLQAACPNAVVGDFGVNIGTVNPSYDVETDLVDFNGTTYNFEPYQVVTAKDDCKNGGWQSLSDADGNGFKNQGSCVSYVVSNRNH